MRAARSRLQATLGSSVLLKWSRWGWKRETTAHGGPGTRGSLGLRPALRLHPEPVAGPPRYLPKASSCSPRPAPQPPRDGEDVWAVRGPGRPPPIFTRKFGLRRDPVPHLTSSERSVLWVRVPTWPRPPLGSHHAAHAAAPATRPAQEGRPEAALPAATAARIPAAGSLLDSDPGRRRCRGGRPSGLDGRQDCVTGDICLSSPRSR